MTDLSLRRFSSGGLALRLGLLAAFLLLVVGGPSLRAQATATLGAVSGTVAVVRADGSAIQPAGPGTPIGPGDRVATVGRSSALLDVAGVGDVELGGDTTVILTDLVAAGDGNAGLVALELVHGLTLHRLGAAAGTSFEYRVTDPAGQAQARARGTPEGALFGVGRDENGNLTVARSTFPAGTVTFPTDGDALGDGRARTLTARGEVVDGRVRGSLYDALARGATAGEDDGDTPSTARLPAGQRTGSRDDRRRNDNDDDARNEDAAAIVGGAIGGAATPTATATPTGTASIVATPTATPTVAVTTRPTITPTGTLAATLTAATPIAATPTITTTPATPTPGTTATSTPRATATPTVTSTSTATSTATSVTVPVTIANFVFLPDPVRVPVGGTVSWINLDADVHTATAEDLSWTSPVLGQNDTYRRTFTQRGTFNYFCEPHPQMRAEVIVE